jgi:peptide/nickel transport system permease protein
MDAVEEVKPKEIEKPRKKPESGAVRVLKYSGVRLLSLSASLVIAVFLTLMIANMGGYVDRIQLGEIRYNVTQAFNANISYRTLSVEERNKFIEEQVAVKVHQEGLDKPFAVRVIAYMKNGLALNFGQAIRMTSNSGSKNVRDIILERLPPTLLLWGTSSFLLFFFELSIALSISRKYGSFWDKFFVGMAPLSAAPGWFYGIFMILIFAGFLKILPFGGMMDAPVPETTLGYTLSLLKHLILPVMSLALAATFVRIFAWRTFFLIYSSEDYVEMAKAKGLGDRAVERRYVLRPTLPTIVTQFSFLLIGAWVGGPITETVFQWPGLGRAFFQAVGFNDIPVILANTVIYAYMLMIIVFLLEYIYVLLDPRVKIGGQRGENQ